MPVVANAPLIIAAVAADVAPVVAIIDLNAVNMLVPDAMRALKTRSCIALDAHSPLITLRAIFNGNTTAYTLAK